MRNTTGHKVGSYIETMHFCDSVLNDSKSLCYTDILLSKRLWLYSNRYSLFSDLTRCRLIISYRRFRTTCLPHIQVLGPLGCPDTSVTNYETMLSNIPEERRSHLHPGCSLKPRKDFQIKFVTQAAVLQHSTFNVWCLISRHQ